MSRRRIQSHQRFVNDVFDFSFTIILESDACDIGIGHRLKISNINDNIVSYGSAKFTGAEGNWDVVEKEASAVFEKKALFVGEKRLKMLCLYHPN